MHQINKERDEMVYKIYQEKNKSLREIGHIFKISRQRIHQIIHEFKTKYEKVN